MLKTFVIIMQHAINNSEIHVFIHIGLFKHVATYAIGKK